jgi:hypothetical protein
VAVETDRVIISRSGSSAPGGYRFPREVIAVAVRWYLRYGLSYRDVEDLLAERGITVDHAAVYRWVQTFTGEFIDAARPARHATGNRWFVDATYREPAQRAFFESVCSATLSALNHVSPGPPKLPIARSHSFTSAHMTSAICFIEVSTFLKSSTSFLVGTSFPLMKRSKYGATWSSACFLPALRFLINAVACGSCAILAPQVVRYGRSDRSERSAVPRSVEVMWTRDQSVRLGGNHNERRHVHHPA